MFFSTSILFINDKPSIILVLYNSILLVAYISVTVNEYKGTGEMWDSQ